MSLPVALFLALLFAPTTTPLQEPQGGSAEEGYYSNQRLTKWFEEMEAIFEDEAAIQRGEEILAKSLEFHNWERFQEVGGLRLDVEWQESRIGRGEEVKNLTRGAGRLFLLPGRKGIYMSGNPQRPGKVGDDSVRLVHDGETSWTHSDGRDNHQAAVAKRVWSRVQLERLLCGLPFAFADPGLDVAFVEESSVFLPTPDGEQEFPTYRLRLRLPKPTVMSLYIYGDKPEPVTIVHAEIHQDNHQLAEIDYYMFRSGRPDLSEPWFLYRHDFSRETMNETYRVPAVRLTGMDSEGKIGREYHVVHVAEELPPEHYFERGWEFDLPETPLGVGDAPAEAGADKGGM